MFSSAKVALFSASSKLFSKNIETRINTNEMLCEARVMSKVKPVAAVTQVNTTLYHCIVREAFMYCEALCKQLGEF